MFKYLFLLMFLIGCNDNTQRIEVIEKIQEELINSNMDQAADALNQHILINTLEHRICILEAKRLDNIKPGSYVWNDRGYKYQIVDTDTKHSYYCLLFDGHIQNVCSGDIEHLKTLLQELNYVDRECK